MSNGHFECEGIYSPEDEAMIVTITGIDMTHAHKLGNELNLWLQAWFAENIPGGQITDRSPPETPLQ